MVDFAAYQAMKAGADKDQLGADLRVMGDHFAADDPKPGVR
jgi:hypothetical protein